MKKISLLICAALGLAQAAAAGVKVMPVANATLSGGQYLLDDDAASVQGRADAFVSPVIKLSEDHELVPVYSGYFNGTQDVQELAGGGVLTRQRQGHTFSLKYVYSRDFDRYKPRVSWSKALIRETKDEKWGKGLFDYSTLSFGFEAEQERPHGTFTESYDFYSVSYPNYSTLLSQAGTVIDTATFNQLSANAGVDTMDTSNHRLAFSYTWFPEPLTMQAGYSLVYRKYPDQAVVGKPVAGSAFFKSDKRSELQHELSWKAGRNLKPLTMTLGARLGWLDSNQNSYDSSRTKFIEDYYSYLELGLSPAVTVALKNGATLGFSADYSRLNYLGRLKQDASGNYAADNKISQDVWLTSLTVRWPLMKGFHLRGSYNYQVSGSNMRYEANYLYNYKASTWLTGVEWNF